ncbi:MAG: hypothetical protein ACE5IL_08950 [Myxococcota bacterium]
MRTLLWIFGAFTAVAGLYAYGFPAAFFAAVASHTGPFNVHLMRDVGAAYLTAGAALLVAAGRPGWRAPLTSAAGLFLGLHAAVHALESPGQDLAHIAEDGLLVVLPAVVVAGVALQLVRQERRARAREGLETGANAKPPASR